MPEGDTRELVRQSRGQICPGVRISFYDITTVTGRKGLTIERTKGRTRGLASSTGTRPIIAWCSSGCRTQRLQG